MKISEVAKKRLQEVEQELLGLDYESVWQKKIESFPYDKLFTLWVNLADNKPSVLVSLNTYLNPMITIYELKPTSILKLKGNEE